ncbi:hypothetical protein AQI95_11715 [Streptomyces yokosukanensis]|uniref:Uncharacterized protein n=1 Tax=Streptomyces yokosukanensis TaxID=67386 RepID=A0A101P974_9ACTN|nr:hypothetical protein [Streptomyces yokosukanensis]KUN07202.1 hypothetical protein AQI95_11715 [Streptomyces yokosukanensis]
MPMQSVSEIRGDLQEFVRGGGGSAAVERAFAAVGQLADSELQRTDEHDVAMLLCLAGVCAGLAGGGPTALELRAVADRYADTSILYTGRVLPRVEETVELIYRGVEEKSAEILLEAADAISQGWAEYARSDFPAAFSQLASALGIEGTGDEFLETSYVSWKRGLEDSARGSVEEALAAFGTSLEKYRKYSYYADAAWLYTDLVIARLLSGEVQAAVRVLDEQRRYVDDVIASAGHRPATEGTSYAFHLGDVRSGGYSSFVDSAVVGPQGLGPDDRALLRRYVRVSESLLAYAGSRSRRDLDAALDLFSFGWLGYLDSPYPEIFHRLVRHLEGPEPVAPLLLTVHVRWRGLLQASQLRIRSADLIRTAMDLRERLQAAGLETEADIALLDAGMLHFALYGKAATASWLSRQLAELRRLVPGPLQAVVEALQVPPQAGLQTPLAHYLGARAAHRVPDFMPAFGVFRRDLRSRRELPAEVDLACYGESLWINGILIYETAPAALVAILGELGCELTQARAEEREVPYLSAAELAERTGRTSSAVVQVVRRFRAVCQEQLDRSTELGLKPDDVLQGRPGYRFSPTVVGEVEFRLLPGKSPT